jgi:hypothetical protein
MFYYFVAWAKLLQLFLVIFLCSIFSLIEVFSWLVRSLPAVWLLLVPMPSVARPPLLLWMWLLWPLPLSPPARFKIPEKFLPVAGMEYSQNRNFDRNFDFVPVIYGVFKVINVK